MLIVKSDGVPKTLDIKFFGDRFIDPIVALDSNKCLSLLSTINFDIINLDIYVSGNHEYSDIQKEIHKSNHRKDRLNYY